MILKLNLIKRKKRKKKCLIVNGPIRFFTCGKPVGYIIGIILLIILAGSCASQQLGKIRSDFFSLFSFPFCGILFRGITNKPNQTKPNQKNNCKKIHSCGYFYFFHYNPHRWRTRPFWLHSTIGYKEKNMKKLSLILW